MTDDVPVRDAATVVLLRDGADGIETWMLTRVAQMAFAAGMSVFPGGRVEAADADLPFAGDACASVAGRFGCSADLARALVGAAVRETFEETGVLLAVPYVDLSTHRADVEDGRIGFGELLREHGLRVDAGLLHPWARWITPPGERRRYDTRFFVGALPDGAVAQNVTSESSTAQWVPVRRALVEGERGERRMLPPTLATLGSLATFGRLREALNASADRTLEAVRPTLRITDDGDVVAELPDGTSVTMPRGALG